MGRPLIDLDDFSPQVGSFPLSTMFGMCSCFLAVCFGCQKQFAALLHQEQAGNHFNEDDRVELDRRSAPSEKTNLGSPKEVEVTSV